MYSMTEFLWCENFHGPAFTFLLSDSSVDFDDDFTSFRCDFVCLFVYACSVYYTCTCLMKAACSVKGVISVSCD